MDTLNDHYRGNDALAERSIYLGVVVIVTVPESNVLPYPFDEAVTVVSVVLCPTAPRESTSYYIDPGQTLVGGNLSPPPAKPRISRWLALDPSYNGLTHEGCAERSEDDAKSQSGGSAVEAEGLARPKASSTTGATRLRRGRAKRSEARLGCRMQRVRCPMTTGHQCPRLHGGPVPDGTFPRKGVRSWQLMRSVAQVNSSQATADRWCVGGARHRARPCMRHCNATTNTTIKRWCFDAMRRIIARDPNATRMCNPRRTRRNNLKECSHGLASKPTNPRYDPATGTSPPSTGTKTSPSSNTQCLSLHVKETNTVDCAVRRDVR